MSMNGASINGVTIGPPASTEEVVGAEVRTDVECPAVARTAPRSVFLATVFVFLDLFPKIPDPLLSSILFESHLLSSIYSEFHRQSPFLKCRNRCQKSIPSISKKTLSSNHEISL